MGNWEKENHNCKESNIESSTISADQVSISVSRSRSNNKKYISICIANTSRTATDFLAAETAEKAEKRYTEEYPISQCDSTIKDNHSQSMQINVARYRMDRDWKWWRLARPSSAKNEINLKSNRDFHWCECSMDYLALFRVDSFSLTLQLPI